MEGQDWGPAGEAIYSSGSWGMGGGRVGKHGTQGMVQRSQVLGRLMHHTGKRQGSLAGLGWGC